MQPVRIDRLPFADVPRPPTEDELPYSDGMPMASLRHVLQLGLLMDVLLLAWADRTDVFVGGSMFVYFSPDLVRTRDFRGPDLFVAHGAERRDRKSGVVWDEGKGPDVVIELLSESTATFDTTEKKAIYQDRLRVPEYFWFDPLSAEFARFALHDGAYQPIEADLGGSLPCRQLGLRLDRWRGTHGGVEATWLRWATGEGTLLPTGAQLAEQGRQLAEAERGRVEAERGRAERAERQPADLRARLARLEGTGGPPERGS